MADIAELGFKVDDRDVVRATGSLDKLGDQAQRTGTATQQMQRGVERAARSMRSFGDGAVAVGGFLSTRVTAPLVAASAAAAAFASRFASAGDEIAKAADKIGVSTSALQELRFAAERGGVGAQVFDTALQRLSRRTAEAAQGGGTLAKVLEQYGIAAADAAGNAKPVEQVIGDIADAIQAAGSESEALRIAFAAFDTEGAGLVNALRGGSEGLDEMRQRARELGLVIGEETIRESERFQDNITDLQAQLSAAGNAIGVALIPALNSIAPVLENQVIPGIVRVGEGIAQAIEWFMALPEPVQTAAGVIATVLGAAGPIAIAVGFMTKLFAGLLVASGPIGLLIAAATGLVVAWTIWGDEIKAIVGGAVDYVTNAFAAFRDKIEQIFAGIGDMIISAFRGPFDRIASMTDSVTTRIAGIWQSLSDTLVGNSIIPDMNAAIEADYRRHGAVVIEEAQLTADKIASIYDEMARLRTELAPMTEEESRTTQLENRMELLREGLELELLTRDEYRELEKEAEIEFAEWRFEQLQSQYDLERRMAEEQRRHEQQMLQMRLSAFSGFFGNLATAAAAGGKKFFAIAKALNIAQATIDGIAAAVAAWKVGMQIGGPPLAAAFSAASVAATGAMIHQIASAQIGAASGARATNTGGGGLQPEVTAQPTQAAQPREVVVNIEGEVFTRKTIEQIFEGLDELIGDGARFRVA